MNNPIWVAISPIKVKVEKYVEETIVALMVVCIGSDRTTFGMSDGGQILYCAGPKQKIKN